MASQKIARILTLRERDYTAFHESLWQMCFYFPVWVLCSFAVLGQDFFWMAWLCWEEPFPHQPITYVMHLRLVDAPNRVTKSRQSIAMLTLLPTRVCIVASECLCGGCTCCRLHGTSTVPMHTCSWTSTRRTSGQCLFITSSHWRWYTLPMSVGTHHIRVLDGVVLYCTRALCGCSLLHRVLPLSASLHSYYRVGLLVFWSFDICDVFLHLSKAHRYIVNVRSLPDPYKLFLFAMVPVTWLLFRIIFFPWKVLTTAFAYSIMYGGWANVSAWGLFNSLLGILTLLQVRRAARATNALARTHARTHATSTCDADIDRVGGSSFGFG